MTTDPAVPTRRLLATLGAALVAGGATCTDAETEVLRLGAHLGHRGVQVAATPTTITLALASGEAACLERVGGGLRIDQSITVGTVRRDLLAGRIGTERAIQLLDGVRRQPHAYGLAGIYAGNLIAALGICLILQPGPANVLLVGVCSLLTTWLVRRSARHALLAALLPTVAALVATVVVLAATDAHWISGPLRTLICPIAVLLPGALLSTGIAELATGSLMSGSARIFHGVVQLLLFTLGVVAGCLLMGYPTTALTNQRVDALGWWAAVLGIALVAIGITLSESVPWRLALWSGAVLVATFVTQSAGQRGVSSMPVGAFLGAVVASFASSAIDSLRADVPRLVTFLPSFWLLVPGTLGLMGITTIGLGTGQSETVISVVTLVTSISLGLLVGSALALPLRRIARRLHRAA